MKLSTGMSKKLILVIGLFFFFPMSTYAQPKPQNGPKGKTSKQATGRVIPDSQKAKSKKANTTEPASRVGNEATTSSGSPSASEGAETINSAQMEASKVEPPTTENPATYYRMNRSSLTILPVNIFIPGLEERDKDHKPVYKPAELFKRLKVTPVKGDVFVSSKHYYNKIRFDTYKIFTELLRDTTNFYELTGLKPAVDTEKKPFSLKELTKKTGKSTKKQKADSGNKTTEISGLADQEASVIKRQKNSLGDVLSDGEYSEEEGVLGQKIREMLVEGDAGTDIMRIWTNKTILRERRILATTSRDTIEHIDTQRLGIWKNLLRKNYVLVLALINPEKKHTTYSDSQGKVVQNDYLGTAIEGFLYHVDTTGLNINNIRSKHQLRFVGRVSMPTTVCDPLNEEVVTRWPDITSEGLRQKVGEYMATDMRKKADLFYEEKAFVCAKNYYEYVLATSKPADANNIRVLIRRCNEQITRNRLPEDKTCLLNETSLFDDWVYAQSASNVLVQHFERKIPDLKVQSSIFKTKPYIAAEIGKKEGVYIDQRFVVYRNTLSESGKTGRQRVGTLRAVKVGNNNNDKPSEAPPKTAGLLSNVEVTGGLATAYRDLVNIRSKNSSNQKKTDEKAQASVKNTPTKRDRIDSLMTIDLASMSVFKQVDGGKIEEFDLVEQNEDQGVGIHLGYGTRLGIPAFAIGGDLRLAKITKGMLPLAGMKLGVNASFVSASRMAQDWNISREGDEDVKILLDAYLARDLYLSPKFDLRPMAGVCIFNESYNPLLGLAGSFNIMGRNRDTKVKLVPELSYVLGYAFQTNVYLKFEF